MKYISAKQILMDSNRFDLFVKYLYLSNKDCESDFYKNLYLAHEKSFNNFYEAEPSDGIEKKGPEAFLKQFDAVFESIKKNGFDISKGIIPIGKNNEIADGAHRLVASAYLNIDVPVEYVDRNDNYDYEFFEKRNFDQNYSDFTALEYVKFNPNAYIVNLHAVVPVSQDVNVERILRKYGRIYYKKKVHLTENGYVNIKKLSYGSYWDKESWIGSVSNNFAGAHDHAIKSKGHGDFLRAYVFICDNQKSLIEIKKEVRALFNIGNYCIHINDCREEAIALAEIYFNDNSIEIINKRDFCFEDTKFDSLLNDFKSRIEFDKLKIDDFCIGGSSLMNVLGMRKSEDIDFLYTGKNQFTGEDEIISSHNSELKYYPATISEIIYNPNYFFYYYKFKFISIDVLIKLKEKRSEKPKDINDVRELKKLKKKNVAIKIKRHFSIKQTVLYQGLRKVYHLLKNNRGL